MRMSASRYLHLGDSLGWMRFCPLASYYSRNGFLANPGSPVLWEAHDIIYRSSQQAVGLPPLPGWGWGRLGSSCSSGLRFTNCELLPVAEPPPQRCARDPGLGRCGDSLLFPGTWDLWSANLQLPNSRADTAGFPLSWLWYLKGHYG